MYEGIDESALREYIINKFTAEGDFDFLKEGELPAIVEAMRGFDEEYMQASGANEGEIYDDDDAYELIFTRLQAAYPQYKMYCMRLAEDYLDFAEEYLASVGALEWE